MSFIELQEIYKVYNEKTLSIDNFSLNIEKNEFVALIGPSGCGKSTMLRMIAGLEDITYGNFLVDGKRMNNVHAKDRDMSFVFQNYALYPHLTTSENIAFGLKLRKVSKNVINERVSEVAEILDITAYLDRTPSELSGGQRQRVALGRAMVQNSDIFLMDEPLSNLDAKLRAKMRLEILKLHRKLGVTTIYVTHDQVEAMTMADKIVVLNKGQIQQVGTPKDLYYNPNNLFVAQFVGDPDINIMRGVVEGTQVKIGDVTVDLSPNTYTDITKYNGKEVLVGVRPENFRVENVYLECAENKISSKIDLVEMRGDSNIIITNFENQDIAIKTQSNQNYEVDEMIEYTINPSKVFLFDKESGSRI